MNVNKSNEYIKETLEQYCKSQVNDSAFKVSATHMIHISEEEFNEVKKSKLKYEALSVTRLRFAVIDISNKVYLLIIGTDNIVMENDDFVPTPLDKILFLSIVETLKLGIRDGVSHSLIEETIYPIENDASGYELDSIIVLFEPVAVYEIPPQEIEKETQFKTHIAKILLTNLNYTYLSFSENTIKSYMQYYNNIHYDDNIFNSLLAYCWRYCFLDVYRCLEPIFGHIPVSELKKEIGISNSVGSLFEKIYRHCGWRPQETSSMEKIFTEDYLSKDLLEQLHSLNIGDSPDEKVGNSIYKLRNKIVHHQGVSSDIEKSLSKDNWDRLVGLLLDAITELRRKYPCDA